MNYYNAAAPEECKISTDRAPIGHVTVNRTYNISERLTYLTKSLEEKLYPIISTKKEDKECLASIREEYPPMFNELRNFLDSMECSLDQLEKILQRIEV